VLVGLAVAAAACEREPSELRRPWADADLEAVTLNGTTLHARRVGQHGREEVLSLGPARAGDAWLHIAVEGSSGARAVLDPIDPSTAAPCVVEGTPARWQPCRLAIDRAVPDLRVRVRLDGPEDARAIVSAPLVRSGRPAPSLVIVILTDTLRADCLATYRPGFGLGGAIDRLARDGIVLDHAFSSSSWTRTAVTTLLTGLDASTHRVLERDDVLPRDLDGLPKAMQRAGYQTLAWSANPNILPIWGFDAGFDLFADVGGSTWPKEKAHAGTVLAAALAGLDDRAPAPTLLYVHLMDPHAPYRPAPPDLDAVTHDPGLLATFPGMDAPEAVRADYAAYLAEVRGMDRELGAFFDALRARALYDDATILLVADHGEEFFDHGGIRHAKTLYQEMLHVPVILKLPRNAHAGTHIVGDVGLADLAPTLLGSLALGGLQAADGRDLWDPAADGLRDQSAAQSALLQIDTFHKAALIARPRKLIIDYRGADRLFDLSSDPAERHDLLPAAAAEAGQLRAALDARIARRESGWHVRACGAAQAERHRLELQVRGDVHGAFLEEQDTLRAVDSRGEVGAYEADLDLTPRPSERVIDGQLWSGLRPDEDELVASSPDADALIVRAAEGEPIRYASGLGPPREPATAFTARADDAAVRLRPSDAPECRPQPGADGARTDPDPGFYVRIWYVPPSEHVDDGQVDPALQERLRALGYQR